MDLAISTGVTPFGKSFTLPSGKVTWIWSMRVFLACKQNCRECSYVEYRRGGDGRSGGRGGVETAPSGGPKKRCLGRHQLRGEYWRAGRHIRAAPGRRVLLARP